MGKSNEFNLESKDAGHKKDYTNESKLNEKPIKQQSNVMISYHKIKRFIPFALVGLMDIAIILSLLDPRLMFPEYMWNKNEVIATVGSLLILLASFMVFLSYYFNRFMTIKKEHNQTQEQEQNDYARKAKILALLAMIFVIVGDVLVVDRVLAQLIYLYTLFILFIYTLLVRLFYPDYYNRLIQSLNNLPYVELKPDLIAFARSYTINWGPIILLAGIIGVIMVYLSIKSNLWEKLSESQSLVKLKQFYFYSKPPFTNIIVFSFSFVIFYLIGVVFDTQVALLLLVSFFGIVYEIFHSLYHVGKKMLAREKEQEFWEMFLSKRAAKYISVGSLLTGVVLGIITLFLTNDQGYATLLLVIGYFSIPIGRAVLSFIIQISDPKVTKYTIRRILGLIPLFVGTSIIVYALLVLAGNPVDLIVSQLPPGSSREKLRELYNNLFGFDQPIPVQWANYFFHFLLGDMGESIPFSGSKVFSVISERAIPTLELALIPLVLAVILSLPLGAISAKRQYSMTDNLVSIFSVIGLSIPVFFFLILLVGIFSVNLQLLPTLGNQSEISNVKNLNSLYIKLWVDLFGVPTENDVIFRVYDHLMHLFIPVVALTLLQLALYVRLVRSGMLEEIRKDYFLSGRASGFSEQIMTRRALKNVLIPLATFVGISVGASLGGAPLTETVMAWPGLGQYAIKSIASLDYPAVMATTLIVAIMIMLANLITDIVYSILDPRIRLE